MNIEYLTAVKAKDPIIIAENVKASYGEVVMVKLPNGDSRSGQVIAIDEGKAVIEVFKGVSGVNPSKVKVITTGRTATMKVSPLMIGRFFSGDYTPLDGKPSINSVEERDINGLVMNPVSRVVPDEFIQTGISSIDGLNSIVRGQKIAIFSSKTINNYRLAVQLVKQSRILSKDEDFAVVFCGLGIPHEVADYFIKEFKSEGIFNKTCVFLNKADSPIIERITAPRYALTAAEYLAFDLNMHVLVLMLDMTSYCNALRELSSTKEEIPMRLGYPSYMYSDLASIYERCGRIKGSSGSLTLIPMLTMPNDDITHPIPDLTGYITEGQIILSKDLYKRNIYPPVNILPSLSRLMHNGIGDGKTRIDHKAVANQLYVAYAKAKQIKDTAEIIGLESVSEQDKLYIDFINSFEKEFLNQGVNENRSINKTLDIAWSNLSLLNPLSLNLLSDELKSKYLKNFSSTENHDAD